MSATPVLITATGPDKPGVSSVLFAALTRHGVEVLDIEQVVIRGQLVLGVLVGVDSDPEGLQEAVEQAMATVSMNVEVRIGSAIGTDPFAPGRQGSTHVLVLLGRPVTARAFTEVAGRLAAVGANIDTIRSIADYPVTGLEVHASVVQDTPEADAELRSMLADVGSRGGLDVSPLASDVRERAICIILSGSGTNGTAGIRAAKADGGLIIVQDPSTARFTGMPRSAIGSGLVDLVLPPGEMPKALADYIRHPYMKFVQGETDEQPEQKLGSVLALLRTRTNHDFRGYKKSTIARRVFRRMGLRRVTEFSDYTQILRNEPDEMTALIRDLMISVTGFFRDREAWEEIDEKVIKPLVQERNPDTPIRVWVPACATGEEAYTLAMLFVERCQEKQKKLDIKIFATDASPDVLAKARAAVYPASAVAGISAERLQRFFDRHEDSYQIKKELRELVIFAPQDILTDPPFSRLDIATCRNLLIYLEPQLQRRVISLLYFALREGGYLFLGNAENISGSETLFQVISKKWRIFRRIGPTRGDKVEFPIPGSPRTVASPADANAVPPRSRHRAVEQAQRLMIEEYAPPSVLIDERFRIIYYHGNTELYLRQPAGEPTHDLLSLLREGLRAKLRNAVQAAHSQRQRMRFIGRIKRENAYVTVEVTIVPANSEPEQEARFLISFSDAPDHIAPANQNPGEIVSETVITEHDLEEELRSVREELRSTIEQLESSNEEMKASNEEVTSMNEELQSTNEELETSKEELQSLNEELNTVNTQLQTKVEELEDRTNDLNNLLNSADIATLFLDSRFTIRWFTPAMHALLDLLPGDIGRPITHFALKFEDPNFLKDTELVLRTLTPREVEVKNEQGSWYVRRILPYRTHDNRIEGVVVTFIDITERRKWIDDVRQERDFAERILSTLEESLVVLEPDLRVKTANRSFYEKFQLLRGQVEGRPLFEISHGEWDIPELRRVLSTDLPLETLMHNIIVDYPTSDGAKRCLSINVRSLEFGRLILLVIEDITERHDYERRQEILLAELQHRVKNILASTQAIARMTHQRSTNLEEFWSAFQGRLMALAGTQELLTRAQLEEVSLAELVERELAAQGARKEDYHLEGPYLPLTAKAAENLALALHELTTNASKHGALAQEGGRVNIIWRALDGRVRFEWIERGGPSVKNPKHRGFGMELIEKAIPYQLHGESNLHFSHDGFHCKLDFPIQGNVNPLEQKGGQAAKASTPVR